MTVYSNALNFANAIVTMINAGSPYNGVAVAAVKSLDPDYDMKEMGDDLYVIALPLREERERITRSKSKKTYTINVLVQKRVATADDADVDPIVRLAGNIADALDKQHLTGFDGAVVVEVRLDPIIHFPHLQEQRVATSMIVLTVEVIE